MEVGNFMFFASSNLICARARWSVRPGEHSRIGPRALNLGLMSAIHLLIGRSQSATRRDSEGGQNI